MHGGLPHHLRTVIEWIEAEEIDSLATAARRLANVDGVLVPGGFGKRGIQGMIYAIQHAREQKVPYFGICLGMQCATIEYARNVAGLADANSTEFDPQTPHRVIYKLRELLGVDEMGGTMRLGTWPCRIEPGSLCPSRLRSARDQRTPSAPLRIQSRLRAAADGSGPAHHGPHAGRHLRGDRGGSRSSLVSGLPVSSRIQVEAARAASAVRRFCRGRGAAREARSHAGRKSRGYGGPSREAQLARALPTLRKSLPGTLPICKSAPSRIGLHSR